MIKSLSIVYPIFNEENRLNNILLDINKFNKKTNFIKKEYIFVNDGSSDKSNLILENFIKKNKNQKINYKIINYKKNNGKGFALRSGVKYSSKDWVLTTDSDCSVSNFQVIKWLNKNYIIKKDNVYFGSRNHPFSKVKKIKSRKILGALFQFTILIFFGIKISDTQCGFKLYHSSVVKKIFKKVKTDGYMHDIEIAIIAKILKIKIKELPVKWSHKTDGKISFFKDSIKIIVSLIKIKFCKY